MDLGLIVIVLVILYFMYSRYVEKYVRRYDPLLDRLRYDLIQVHPRAAFLNYFVGDKSYTDNKRDMFLCLRDENGNYYPYNMLIYVSLHELAHSISKSVDPEHKTREFNENFDRLLDKAARLGIYDKNAPLVENYCGVSSKN